MRKHSGKTDYDKIIRYAGKPVSKKGVRVTLSLIRWYKDFIASRSELAKIPGDPWGQTMNRDRAARELFHMLHIAINRKAGWEDEPGRKYTSYYQNAAWADARRVRDIVNRRLIHRGGFNTAEVNRRFGHLKHVDD